MLELKINIFEADEYIEDLNIFVSDTIIIYDSSIIELYNVLPVLEYFMYSDLIAYTGFTVVANAPPVLKNNFTY